MISEKIVHVNGNAPIVRIKYENAVVTVYTPAPQLISKPIVVQNNAVLRFAEVAQKADKMLSEQM